MTADGGPGRGMEGKKERRGLSKDALLWGGVLLGAAALGVYLLRNLGTLSLWMDEGFHYLSVQSILERGVPIFPSGHAYFKAILYCYALAGLAAVGGLNAFTLRLGSVLCYAALIPVVYLVVKRYATRTAALITAVALAFSVWGVEYARAALYFAPLQLVMMLAFYAFYRGYFEERPRARVWAWILFLAVPHVHQLGEAVAFAFVALLLLKGLKRFLRRDSLLFAAVIFVYYGGIQLWEFFGWQVGYVYERTDSSVGGLIKYFFSSFSMAYFREFSRAFPVMSLLILGGAFFLLATMVWKWTRGADATPAPAAASDPDQPWAYFYLCLLFPLLFLGFFRTHVQPRYLTPLYPLFVILFVDACRRLAPGAVRLLVEPFVRLRAEKTRRIISGAAFLALAFATVEGVSPRRVANIVNRRYQSRIDTDLLTRSGRLAQEDYRTTGEFVKHFLEPNDLVVAIHVVFGRIYAGRVDYWLWSGGPGTWDAWEKTADGWKDFYVGARWINTLDGLKKVIDDNPGRRVWVIGSVSTDRRDHISQDIADFLRSDPDRIVFRGQDGVAEVFLWHADGRAPAGAARTFEGEWVPNPPGRIDYLSDASRGAALAVTGRRGDRASNFAAVPPVPFPAGRYRCVVRARVGRVPESAKAPGGRPPLSLFVFSPARKERLRNFSITAAELQPGGPFREFSFDFALDREERPEFRFAAVPGLVFDFLDVRPVLRLTNSLND